MLIMNVLKLMNLKAKPPEILITTPESLHLLLAQKGYPDFFKNLKVLVADVLGDEAMLGKFLSLI